MSVLRVYGIVKIKGGSYLTTRHLREWHTTAHQQLVETSFRVTG